MTEILRLIKQYKKRPLIIAIDGMCAAGKTTLAEKLSAALNAPVIHTDDFFIPARQRTGCENINIDVGRFFNDVLIPLKKNIGFCYDVFDCKIQKMSFTRQIEKSEFYIIEGCYCMYPQFADIYDIKVFMEIDAKLQRTRLALRESADSVKQFESRWIPFENRYFELYKIKEGCDIIL